VRHSVAGVIAVCVALGGWFSLRAQSEVPNAAQTVAVPPPPEVVLVPVGTPLGLELQDSLNSKFTVKGDPVTFKVTQEVVVGGRVVIPRETTVNGTVIVAKRAGPARQKGQLRLEFNKIVLADGTCLPLTARLTRVGRWHRSSKITPETPGDRDVLQDFLNVLQVAGAGAGLGALGGGAQGAAAGAAIGAGVTLAAILLERGPELDLPPGIMFQIEIAQPLKVPITVLPGAVLPPRAEGVIAAASEKVAVPQQDTSTGTSAAAIPPPSVPIPQIADTPIAGGEPTVTFKSDVNAVMVEVTVRDARGAVYIKAKAEDFVVSEDGVEQKIRHFSRDELPLAVAVVIDRSGSVAPIMSRLRRAAYEILSQLKPADQVALFTFDSGCQLVEELTADRQRIANSISAIQAGGGTNIKDAHYEAAVYLSHEAASRRRAIILISDNQETVNSRAGEGQVIRMALETESAIYSIKVGDRSPAGMRPFPVALPRSSSVNKITQDTGGEIFDTRETGSVETAMQAVISRLKLRFTLGYQSTNTRRDGAFRRIEVRVTRQDESAAPFTVYYRRGYYAPRPGEDSFAPARVETALVSSRRSSRPRADPGEEREKSKLFTNEDVLKLVQGGFGEEAILAAIQGNQCHFDTSAEALLKLKNAGVGEKVILAMLTAGRGPVISAASPKESDGLPAEPGVYLLKDGTYVRVDVEQVQWRRSTWTSLNTSGGVTTTTLTARMGVPESPLRVSGGSEFLLVSGGSGAETWYHLLRAEDNRKDREFRAEFQVLDDGSYLATGGTRKSQVQFTAKELGAGKYMLKLPESAKGQLAFMPPTNGTSGRLYTFGVQ
jgi:Ca-activated chloride channel homolog